MNIDATSDAEFWRQSEAKSSATQHAVVPEFGGKWGAKCLNNRLP